MKKRKWFFQEATLLAAVILLVVVSAWRDPKFLNAYNLQVIAREAALFGIMGIGETLVILTAGIDLSPGSLVALSGVVVAYLIVFAKFPIPLAVITVILMGMLIGFWHGLFVTKLRVPPFIITLGTLSAARGLATVICTTVTGGQPIVNLPEEFAALGQKSLWGWLPIPVLILIIFATIAGILLYRMRFGRYVFAVGGNLEAARLAGVPVNFVRSVCYMTSASLAAIAGILTAAYVNSGDPNVGVAWELYVIAAVVIGGTSLMGGQGTLWGTLLGALFMSVLKNGLLFWNVPPPWHEVVIGAVVVSAVTLDTLRRRRYGD
ncbi:MAG: ABC transporter permease [Armatimonadetes bacterium]|nr:ABC transporter permease [Armatimonadota bacterium]MCX7968184.1 ABC transporter permease [Armatimonadota bacterium]MDW8142803.1 ABC transporter permease [Armatimonadota bacterium]